MQERTTNLGLVALLLIASALVATPTDAQAAEGERQGMILRLGAQGTLDGEPVDIVVTGGGRTTDQSSTTMTSHSLQVAVSVSGMESVRGARFTHDPNGGWTLLVGDGVSAFGHVDGATGLQGNATSTSQGLELSSGGGTLLLDGMQVEAVAATGTVRWADVFMIGLEPLGDGAGDGAAMVLVQDDHEALCWWLRIDGVDGVASAHIHDAPTGEDGPVAVPLTAPSTGTSAGCTVDGAGDRAMFERIASDPSDFYVNVHSADRPEGALRGQLDGEDGAARAGPQGAESQAAASPAAGVAAMLALLGAALVVTSRRRDR